MKKLIFIAISFLMICSAVACEKQDEQIGNTPIETVDQPAQYYISESTEAFDQRLIGTWKCENLDGARMKDMTFTFEENGVGKLQTCKDFKFTYLITPYKLGISFGGALNTDCEHGYPHLLNAKEHITYSYRFEGDYLIVGDNFLYLRKIG